MSKNCVGTTAYRAALVIAALVGSLLAGCQTAYFKTMETLGFQKRDILVSRVKAARDSQEEVKEEFASALDEFRAVLRVQGGELEQQYDQLRATLDDCETRATTVYERVDEVERVAEALFAEWEGELDDYDNEKLRRSSERSLRETRRHYEELMRAMRRAESKMEPVLVPLRDQVLFLKHNLNARAIASLQQELVEIETDVDSLVEEMEAAIAEANAFIASMEGGD